MIGILFTFRKGNYTIFQVSFICDQFDALMDLLKKSISNFDIEVPLDYFVLDSYNTLGLPTDDINSLECSKIIRDTIKRYNFKTTYDEIFPKKGSNTIEMWKAVEYSDMGLDAINFFRIRNEQGRRIITVQLSFTEFKGGTFFIHFGIGPELSRYSLSFVCKGINGVKKLLTDKFSLLNNK